MQVKDWLGWHDGYDNPASSLARRLQVVRRQLHRALDEVDATRPRLLSLCAGDGRDVISVLAARPAQPQVAAILIESDPTLAARAQKAASDAGLSCVQVRCGDAGALASFSDFLPVDVLMLCGIFGNIEHSQVKTAVDAIPALVGADGFVIWTRGAPEPDRRLEIRRWFMSAGLAEVAFEGAPEPYGVGTNRQPHVRHCLPSSRPRTVCSPSSRRPITASATSCSDALECRLNGDVLRRSRPPGGRAAGSAVRRIGSPTASPRADP